MKNEPSFDHRPDPELGAALRAALEPKDDHAAFAARVMAQYERALGRASVATLDVLASWFRPGIAAAVAALPRCPREIFEPGAGSELRAAGLRPRDHRTAPSRDRFAVGQGPAAVRL